MAGAGPGWIKELVIKRVARTPMLSKDRANDSSVFPAAYMPQYQVPTGQAPGKTKY